VWNIKTLLRCLVSSPSSENKVFMCSAIVPQTNPSESSDFGVVFHPPEGGLFLLLEQLQKTECISRGRPMMKATHHEGKRAVIFRPRCKLWSCPTCATINANRWVAVALNGSNVLIGQGAVLDFFTITSHERLSPEATVRVFPASWNKLRMRLEYAGNGPEWFVVPEQHKDGRLHLHGIVSARLGKRWWKDNARAVGMGYMSDAQEVKSVGGVAGYVSKYLTKTLQFSNWGKGFRRVRSTQGWPKLPDLPEPDGWNFSLLARDAVLQDEINRLLDANYIVAITEHGSAWDFVNSAI